MGNSLGSHVWRDSPILIDEGGEPSCSDGVNGAPKFGEEEEVVEGGYVYLCWS